jgi:hypothetical protein
MTLSPRSVLILSLAALLAVLIWAGQNPATVALDKSCAAQGTAALAELVHGRDFWGAQQRLLLAERDRLLSLPAQLELAREARDKERNLLDEHLNRLSRGDNAQEQREQAAAQRFRAEQLAWVMACEAKAREKLSPP